MEPITDEEEQRPLIPQEPTRSLLINKKLIAQGGFWLSITGLLIGMLYLFVYCYYIPKEIRESMNGIGPNITSVAMSVLFPIWAQVGISLKVDPKPVKTQVDFGDLTLYLLDDDLIETKTPLATFMFGSLVIEPNVNTVTSNNIFRMKQVNVAMVSWMLQQAGEYGLQDMNFEL